jgi:hypothetical protein
MKHAALRFRSAIADTYTPGFGIMGAAPHAVGIGPAICFPGLRRFAHIVWIPYHQRKQRRQHPSSLYPHPLQLLQPQD